MMENWSNPAGTQPPDLLAFEEDIAAMTQALVTPSQATEETRKSPSTTAAVVLAAGAGIRHGGAVHKLRRPVQGRPLIVWSVEAACEAGLDDVYVVTGAEDLSDLLPAEVTVIQNHDWEQGQGSSLRAGILVAEQDGHDAVVAGLGDMPFVSAEAWRAVAAVPGEIVTNTYLGKRRPPVKLAAEVWPLLPLFDDEEGARGLMRRRPELVTEVACSGEAADFDTNYDFTRWRAAAD